MNCDRWSMKQKDKDTCPACGLPKSTHPKILLVPVIFFDKETGKAGRKWKHGDSRLN